MKLRCLGQNYEIEDKLSLIGRDLDNLIATPPEDRRISKRHVLIILNNRGVMVHNLSKNGTYVNDEIVKQGGRKLKPGDRITLGGSLDVEVLKNGN